MHRAALAFAGAGGAAVELGEEPVGIVRLRQEGRVAAVRGKNIGLAVERRTNTDGHEFLAHRHVHRGPHLVFGVMLDDVLFGTPSQEEALEQLYRRRFGQGLAGKNHRYCRCFEVGRTIETSDSQGNGKVLRPVLQPTS